MRVIVAKVGVVAIASGMVLGSATAANDRDTAPEARAYLGFSFGGQEVAPRELHYGLRLDHDSRYTDRHLPPLLQLDYTTRGLSDLRVNGLSAVRKHYRLGQDELDDEIVDEPGFFESVGNWFGGLFGGDDEDEDTEVASESADNLEDDYFAGDAEGAFLGYNALDWGLVAVGAVGLGYIATEVVNGEDSPQAGGGGETTGGQSGGLLGGAIPVGGTTPVGLTPVGFTTSRSLDALDHATVERLQWLDGGTGHMGDLEAVGH